MQISAQHLAEIVDAARKNEKIASDKRRYIRQSVVTRVEILSHSLGTTYGALTRDLSVEGLGLMQSVAMVRGEQFSVSLPRTQARPLLAQCTVLHARDCRGDLGYWGGFCFDIRGGAGRQGGDCCKGGSKANRGEDSGLERGEGRGGWGFNND